MEPTQKVNSDYNIHFLVRQVAHYVPGAIFPAMIGLATSAVFTRTFNVEEYGRYSLVLSVIGVVGSVLANWIQQGIIRYLPSRSGPGAAELKRAAATAVVLLGVAVVALLCVLILALRPVLGKEWTSLLWPAGWTIVSITLFTPLTSILQAEMRAGRHTWYQIISVGLRFAISLMLVFLVRHDVASLLWAAVLGPGLLIPVLWRESQLPSVPAIVRTTAEVRAAIGVMFSYGFPMIGWSLAATTLHLADRFIIQATRGVGEVGIYAANYNLVTRGLALVSAPILLAAHPFLMKAWGNGDARAASKWLTTIAEWFCVLGIIMVAGITLFARDAGALFLGPDFRHGYAIMPVVFAGELIWQLAMYTQKPLEFRNKTGVMFGLALAAAALNVLLNLVFVPRFGYTASAFATLGCYSLYMVITVFLGQRYLRWSVPWRRLAGPLLVAIIAVFAIGFIRPVVDRAFGYGVALIVAICMALVAGLFIGLRLVKPLLAAISSARS